MTERKLVERTIYKVVFGHDKVVAVLENPLDLDKGGWADCTRIRFDSVAVKRERGLYSTDMRYYTAERVLVNLDNVLYIEPIIKTIAEESE